MKRPSEKDLGGYRKRGWWTLTLQLWHSLSLYSICKKSPNLLAALLPPTDLSLKQCQRWVRPCARMRGFPRAIQLNKECIKFCETCFANTLNLNDKGPSIKWICFPKFYGPLTIWPWLRISPHSSLNVIYCLIITAWQWLSFTYMPCIPMQIKPNKSPLRNRPKALLLWEMGYLSSPNRSCLGRIILIHGGCGAGSSAPPWHFLPSPSLKINLKMFLKTYSKYIVSVNYDFLQAFVQGLNYVCLG